MRTFAGTMCAGLLAVFVPLADAAPSDSFCTLVLQPDRIGRLEGECSVLQESGGRTTLELKFQAGLEFLVRAESAGEVARSLLVARRLSPQAADGSGLVASGSSLELFLLDAAGRLERLDGGFSLPPLLESYLPLQEVFPAFELPESDESEAVADIHLLGRLRQGINVRTSVRREPARLTVYREARLPEGGLVVSGEAEKLLEWRDAFYVRHDAAGPRLDAVNRHFRFSIERAGFGYEVSHDLRLRARESRALRPDESRFFSSFEPELRFFLDGVREPLGAGEGPLLRQRAARLSSALSATVFSGLGDTLVAALDKRLGGNSPRAGSRGPSDTFVHRKALAPEFTLETLDGRRVSFHDLARGKVVYLNFWGYG